MTGPHNYYWKTRKDSAVVTLSPSFYSTNIPWNGNREHSINAVFAGGKALLKWHIASLVCLLRVHSLHILAIRWPIFRFLPAASYAGVPLLYKGYCVRLFGYPLTILPWYSHRFWNSNGSILGDGIGTETKVLSECVYNNATYLFIGIVCDVSCCWGVSRCSGGYWWHGPLLMQCRSLFQAIISLLSDKRLF